MSNLRNIHQRQPLDHISTRNCRPTVQPHLRPAFHIAKATQRDTDLTSQTPLVTFQEVQDICKSRGISVSLRTLGPVYRIVFRDNDDTGPILAVTNGFTVSPLKLMHCDTLQIFTKGKKGDDGQRVRGGVLGLGLLVGGATFAFGRESGCTKAEILAINDDEAWHERLVGYYTRFGFKPVVVVDGGKLSDMPHMLVWGGVGTRMDGDIESMLQRWTKAIRNSRKNQEGKEEEAATTTGS